MEPLSPNTYEQQTLNPEQEVQELLLQAEKLSQNVDQNYGGLTEILVEVEQILAGRQRLQHKFDQKVDALRKKIAQNEPPLLSENSKKFQYLLANSPEFIKDSQLLNKIRILFDSNVKGDSFQIKQAQQQLNQAYDEVTNPKTTTTPTVPSSPQKPKPERVTLPPKATSGDIERRIKTFTELADQKMLDRPDIQLLFSHLQSGDETKLPRALAYIDKHIIHLKEKRALTFKISKNYYTLLGISPPANTQEIRQAYKKLAQQFHPDSVIDLSTGTQKRSAEIFQAINEAYSVLSDPAQRRGYDEQLSNPFQSQAPEQRPTQPSNTGGRTVFGDMYGSIARTFMGSMGGIEGNPFATPPNITPSGIHSPREQAEAQARLAREAQIESLEQNLRNAKNINQIMTALKKLHNLKHIFEIREPYDFSGDPKVVKRTPQEIIKLIRAAIDNSIINKQAYSTAIESLPDHLGIKSTVETELRTRVRAFKLLERFDATSSDIKLAFGQLAEMGKRMPVTVSGQRTEIILDDQIKIVNQIVRNSHRPSVANELVTQVTPWHDIDLKIYYSIREREPLYRALWSTTPVPDSIKQRYEAYKKKRVENNF